MKKLPRNKIPKNKVDLKFILEQIVREKGGDPELYLDLLNSIAYHETGPEDRMNPSTYQKGSGAGKGLLQFEDDSLLTAANRLSNYLGVLNAELPDFITDIQSGNITDATQLHPDLQYMLALGDLRMKSGIDLKDYAEGNLSRRDLWADYWWAGDRKERPEKIKAFDESYEDYKKNFNSSIREEFAIPSLFKYGGNMYLNGGNLNNGRGKKKPVYVDDTNDPRYIAYKDSLDLYNQNKIYSERFKSSPNQFEKENELKNSSYFNNVFGDDKIKPIGLSYADGAPAYKKPEQEVILKNREPNLDTDIVAYLQSQGQPYSFAERKKMFKERFPDEDYKGSADQNIKLLQSIKTGEVTEREQPVNNNIETPSRDFNQPLHFQYGYYNDSGEFVRKDYKHNEQGRKEYEEAKKKPGFRKINPESFTQESWRTQPDDRFNYNPNQLKLGGHLTNSNTMNDINIFNEGGTHEQNPLGGIPQGTDAMGNPNLVEQGEARVDDMIFTDRLPLPEHVIEAVGLPKKYAGKTPAKILELIDKTFKDRNDGPSLGTKKDFIDKVTQAQELFKEELQSMNQSMQTNSQEVPDLMNGQIPQGMEQFMPNQFAYGDSIDPDSIRLSGQGSFIPNQHQGGTPSRGEVSSSKGMSSGTMGVLGALGNTAGRIMSNRSGSSTIAGDSNDNAIVDGVKDTVATVGGPIFQLFRGIQKFGQGAGNMVGGEVGAGISDVFSPEESTIANFKDSDLSFGEKLLGTVPILGGVLAHRQQKKREEAAKKKEILSQVNQISPLLNNQNYFYNYGGKLNKYPWGTPNIKNPNPYDPELFNMVVRDPNAFNVGISGIRQQNNLEGAPISVKQPSEEMKDSLFRVKNGKGLDEGAGTRIGTTLLETAPIITNAIQLAKMKRAKPFSYNTVGTRITAPQIDENSAYNLTSNELNNQINLISQMGGSEGAVRSSILGAGLNRTKALGQLLNQTRAQNAMMKLQADQANLQTDLQNVAIRNRAIDERRGDDAAYESNKSALISAIGEDIGKFGRTLADREIAKKITGYRWDGTYVRDSQGNVVSDTELAKTLKLRPLGNGNFVDDKGKEYTKEQLFKMYTPVKQVIGESNAYGGKLKLRKY